MLQILNLSIASEKIVIPPSCFQNFLPSPLFPSKNFNWPAKILLYPFLSPSSCGIHIECSLIRTQIYFSKPLNGWFTKYFPYIIWSWCIRIRRSLISKSENILPATKYPSIHTFGCSLNGKAIRVPGKITWFIKGLKRSYLNDGRL